MIEYLETFLTIGFWVIVAVIILRYGKYLHQKYIFEPLAGGNGKIQMDEAAKGIILGVFIYTVYKEATRDHEWPIFAEAFWWSLMFGIFSVAGLKHVKHMFNKKDGDSKEPPSDSM